jgi:hypothetical protein
MLLQLTNKVGVITWYKINQKQIIELFCINKSKPELKCDGKCYLKNTLKNVDDTEDSKNTIPTNNKSSVEEILFFEKYSSNIFLQFISVRFFIKYSSQLHAAFEPNIFQPPKY